MTLPRQVVPGRDYMITRRCSERRFFLRPDEDTNNAFIYCLGLAAIRANVQVTFSVAMSNHHHTGIHDADGNFPIFTEHFHGLLWGVGGGITSGTRSCPSWSGSCLAGSRSSCFP
jgi:putative transposase